MASNNLAGASRRPAAASTLVIACGALARELVTLKALNGWDHMAITCLNAALHNRPDQITAAVEAKIHANRHRYDEILCLYGDCGTGGALDAMLAREGVPRIAGDHCYAFYAGLDAFDAMAEQELGTFYLTDFLARHFDRLVIQGLGLDRHPHLLEAYFGHYTRLMYLAQSDDPALDAAARSAAERLGLRFATARTGFGLMEAFLQPAPGQPGSAEAAEAGPTVPASAVAAAGSPLAAAPADPA
ncbi:MAG: DUF1638 domain-containing protein [Pseudomonadota bacterium]